MWLKINGQGNIDGPQVIGAGFRDYKVLPSFKVLDWFNLMLVDCNRLVHDDDGKDPVDASGC